MTLFCEQALKKLNTIKRNAVFFEVHFDMI